MHILPVLHITCMLAQHHMSMHDLSRTYLAHHELESVFFIIHYYFIVTIINNNVIIVVVVVVVVIMIMHDSWIHI